MQEKPFKCTICDYRTNRKQHIKVHMKTHMGTFMGTVDEVRKISIPSSVVRMFS